MEGRNREGRMESVGLKKEETAYGTKGNRDMESVGLKKEETAVEGRNRDMESVGLKKEETAYRTKWKDVIEIWKVWA